MKLISLAAILVVIIVIPIYAWWEPIHQKDLLAKYHTESITSAANLYAQSCVVCHGAAGEGIGDNPPLSTQAVQTMSYTDLTKTIARGRPNTTMAAWAVEEGGVLSNAQVNDLVILIQAGKWEFVGEWVAELGLIPPEITQLDVTDEVLDSVSALPNGDQLAEGLLIYGENCAACHGANGSGTLIAPAIDSQELRVMPLEEMTRIINYGIPGTLMTGWQNSLSLEEMNSVIDLIYRWPEMVQSGAEFPQIEPEPIASSPQMIADGDRLYHIACKSCHGSEAYGSPMAPALNNQIFLSQTPDAAIYQIIAGGVPETLMPAWGSRLSDYEIQSLVTYLRSLEADAPPIVPPITDNP
jgi:cbb3-type cytochrome c oxidase subunit III